MSLDASHAEMATHGLRLGDLLPSVMVSTTDGAPILLSDLAGSRPLVVYFYPRDDTPGCTAEACGFRDNYEQFQNAGADVIGISGDGPESHARFVARHRLPFRLVSDPEGLARKAFGVTRTFGIIDGRETFVFDREAKLCYRFASQLRASAHVRLALDEVRKLARA